MAGLAAGFGSEGFAVFELRGVVLALFPVDELAIDGWAGPGTGDGGIRFAIVISMDSLEEVEELADRVRQSGGTVTKEPVGAEFRTGRDAYFAGPVGNYRETARASADNPVTTARRAAGITTDSRTGWSNRPGLRTQAV